MPKRIVLISLCLLFFVIPGRSALAHAELESSSPADGSIVETMPNEITLTFGEKLLTLGEENVNTLNLSTTSGIEVALSPVTVSGEVLSATVVSSPSTLTPGQYQISYRVVSTDGHPVKGEISFEFAPQESAPVPSESPIAIADDQETQAAGAAEPENGLFDVSPLFILFLLFIGLIVAALLLRRKRR